MNLLQRIKTWLGLAKQHCAPTHHTLGPYPTQAFARNVAAELSLREPCVVVGEIYHCESEDEWFVAYTFNTSLSLT